MNTAFILADYISGLLSEKGHSQPIKWQKHLDVKAISKLPYGPQSKLIVRQFKLLFGETELDAAKICASLNDGMSADNWKQFIDNVSDLMIKHNL